MGSRTRDVCLYVLFFIPGLFIWTVFDTRFRDCLYGRPEGTFFTQGLGIVDMGGGKGRSSHLV